MAFPKKLLAPGEEVVVEARPNWTLLLGPFFMLACVLAACIAIALSWASAPVFVAYLLAAVCLLAAFWVLGQVVSWRSRLLVVTTRRVVYRWGALRRTGREIPLERVQDVTYHQTIIERLVGAGSLTVESAGASGQEPFPDVRHPAEIQSLINRLTSEASWRTPPPRQETAAQPERRPADAVAARWVPAPSSDPPTSEVPVVSTAPAWAAKSATEAIGEPARDEPRDASLADQLRDLERLHEAGVITEAEFTRARRQLLGLD